MISVAFLLALASLDGTAIPSAMRGHWAPVTEGCSDPVDRLEIDAQALRWYEATGFLVLGMEYTSSDADGLAGYFMGKDIDGTQFWQSELDIKLSGKRLTVTREVEGQDPVVIVYQPCPAAAR